MGKPQPAAPSQPATPGTEHELQQYRKALCSLLAENLFVVFNPKGGMQELASINN